ncbi:hypothetical protein AVEN_38728-1 [Araneus ventricosus]|uniref:Uncharacterized protein n=1 Tax=Araneus ventricosus TaxID=182803 RepID=A0A4Y2IAR3_ARAVE|nr:hypothetical protein AVEN_38728-1 [Araneus ventricosus]
MYDMYSSCAIIAGLLDITVGFSCLKLLPWVALVLKNGTFGCPEAMLGDNGTSYQKTGRMVTLIMPVHLDRVCYRIFQAEVLLKHLDEESFSSRYTVKMQFQHTHFSYASR